MAPGVSDGAAAAERLGGRLVFLDVAAALPLTGWQCWCNLPNLEFPRYSTLEVGDCMPPQPTVSECEQKRRADAKRMPIHLRPRMGAALSTATSELMEVAHGVRIRHLADSLGCSEVYHRCFDYVC